jgi:hypothetical protein
VRFIAEPEQKPETGAGKDDAAGGADAGAAEAAAEPAGEASDDRGDKRPGEEGEPGSGYRVVPDIGQEEHVAEQQYGEGSEEEQRGKTGERKRQWPKQR